MKNSKEKNHERERKFTILFGYYNEFRRVMLRLQILGFSVIRCKQVEFSVIIFEPFPGGERDIFIPA